MYPVDLHMHTVASTHAYSTLHDYIAEARRKHIQLFATTDHGPDIDPLPVCVPFIVRNNRLHVGCIFWQPADFSTNSEGVIQPSEEWGRLWL